MSDEKKSLIHLDLSFNQFTLESSSIIQSFLLKNKSIFGFHFAGNYGYIGILHFDQRLYYKKIILICFAKNLIFKTYMW